MARQPYLSMQDQYNPIIFLSELFTYIECGSTDLHTPLPETIQLHFKPIELERSWFIRPVFTPIDHYSVPEHNASEDFLHQFFAVSSLPLWNTNSPLLASYQYKVFKLITANLFGITSMAK
jgi:hypothetical protein